MDKETKILNAIMQRYGSLTTLSSHLQEDSDTVIENLSDDIGNNKISNGDIEDYINKVLG